MFHQETDSVLIITDTLATTPDGEPMMFQSKAWALPHLNMVVAVTGTADVGERWTARISGGAVARDIDDVAGFAQAELQAISDELITEHGNIGTTTIYHFGFPTGADKVVRHTFRSTSRYKPELTLEPGFGVKPPPETFELHAPDDIDGLVNLATRIREENNSGLTSKTIWIGGELYGMLVRNWQSQTFRMHRFDDYEDLWKAMTLRLAREHNV